MREPTRWRCRQRTLSLGERTLVMGVLNVTPDSFSDGGRLASVCDAADEGLRMLEAGADILDIGGESSRPGAASVDADTERSRVGPVIERLASRTDALLSIDTRKAAVARAALEAGAHIVNDITALAGDPAMPETVSAYGAGAILMHMQGEPATMQDAPRYAHVLNDVFGFFEARIGALKEAGIDPETLAVDPGFGFGKTLDHNLTLLRGLSIFRALGRPLVVGLSRKRSIGDLTGRPVQERLAGSLAAAVAAVINGADIVRVHDVAATRDAVRVADALIRPRQPEPESCP